MGISNIISTRGQLWRRGLGGVLAAAALLAGGGWEQVFAAPTPEESAEMAKAIQRAAFVGMTRETAREAFHPRGEMSLGGKAIAPAPLAATTKSANAPPTPKPAVVTAPVSLAPPPSSSPKTAAAPARNIAPKADNTPRATSATASSARSSLPAPARRRAALRRTTTAKTRDDEHTASSSSSASPARASVRQRGEGSSFFHKVKLWWQTHFGGKRRER